MSVYVSSLIERMHGFSLDALQRVPCGDLILAGLDSSVAAASGDLSSALVRRCGDTVCMSVYVCGCMYTACVCV